MVIGREIHGFGTRVVSLSASDSLWQKRGNTIDNLYPWQTIIFVAVVVAQLVERSLPIPEVRGSNPVIGKNLLNICLLSTVFWKDENKEKEVGDGPFFLKKQSSLFPKNETRARINVNFCTMLIFKHSDWLLKKFNQSEWSEPVQRIGSGPG